MNAPPNSHQLCPSYHRKIITYFVIHSVIRRTTNNQYPYSYIIFTDSLSSIQMLANYENKNYLYIYKCKVMTFCRKRCKIVHYYNRMCSILLQLEDNYVIDLGFKFSSSLDSSSHINMMCCKAWKTLGFIMRLTKKFSQINTAKSLYCAIVFILEYGSLICDSYTANGYLQVEKVQRTFLKHASFVSGIQCSPNHYSPVSNILDLQPLADCRWVFSNNILRGLLSNIFDSPTLLSL